MSKDRARLAITQVGPGFAARIEGLALDPLPDAPVIEALKQALWEHGVLVFPRAMLSGEALVRMGEAFGPVYAGAQNKALSRYSGAKQHPALSEASNIDPQGQTVPSHSVYATAGPGAWMWHSDASHERPPFRYSLLSGEIVTSCGGETEFADLRAAYDALDAETRALVDGREATFYARHTRHQLGYRDGERWYTMWPPVRWPLVREHPETGRKVLWLDARIVEISGMPVPDGRALVEELLEHASQRERRYAHRWQPGDLVVYDNRAVMHRGRRFDFSEPRKLVRVSTLDDAMPLGLGRWPEYCPEAGEIARDIQ